MSPLPFSFVALVLLRNVRLSRINACFADVKRSCCDYGVFSPRLLQKMVDERPWSPLSPDMNV